MAASNILYQLAQPRTAGHACALARIFRVTDAAMGTGHTVILYCRQNYKNYPSTNGSYLTVTTNESNITVVCILLRLLILCVY